METPAGGDTITRQDKGLALTIRGDCGYSLAGPCGEPADRKERLEWRGGRVAECTGLLNRRTVYDRTAGSNPALSVVFLGGMRTRRGPKGRPAGLTPKTPRSESRPLRCFFGRDENTPRPEGTPRGFDATGVSENLSPVEKPVRRIIRVDALYKITREANSITPTPIATTRISPKPSRMATTSRHMVRSPSQRCGSIYRYRHDGEKKITVLLVSSTEIKPNPYYLFRQESFSGCR